MTRQLIAELTRDEGLKLKPYLDTRGKLTIGIGRNLDDKGIDEREARDLARADILDVCHELDRLIPWWRTLSAARQRALVNMGFNIGPHGLMEFRKMLAALQAGDYPTASREALSSTWATQVGDRAQRIAKLIEDG